MAGQCVVGQFFAKRKRQSSAISIDIVDNEEKLIVGALQWFLPSLHGAQRGARSREQGTLVNQLN